MTPYALRLSIPLLFAAVGLLVGYLMGLGHMLQLNDDPIDSSEAEDVLRDVLVVLEEIRDGE